MDDPGGVEFADKCCGIKLLEYKKELLRKIEQLTPGEKFVVMTRQLQLYFYSLLKEGEGNENSKL